MFREIYKMLNSQDWINTSSEIEVLKGWYEKPKSIQERVTKMTRKYKFKYKK